MESWESVQKALEYIEINLGDKMDINHLSAVANLSPFYFQRLFSRLVGKTVAEYIKLRRLAKAAEFITGGNGRIVDIGLTAGFENHETFSRAFKNYYGLQPEAYRKAPRPLTHFFKPDVSMQYRLIKENMPLAAEGIILEVRRKNLSNPRFFSGISLEAPFPNNPGIDYLAELWNRLHRIKSSLNNVKPDGNEIGVGSPGQKEGCLNYFTGVEVTCYEEAQGDCNWTMPEGGYIVCSFEAESFQALTTNALDKAARYMYKTWLSQNKVSTEPFMAELYFDTGKDADYMEIWFKTK